MKSIHRKLAVLLIIVIFAFVAIPAVSQEAPGDQEEFQELYDLGDQSLSINLGLFAPLFFLSKDLETARTNLSIGGTGSLQWNAYLRSDMTLGLEVSGMFALTPNRRTLFMVPITLRYAYIIRSYPLEFPLIMGAGINFNKLGDSFHLDQILMPGASIYWNINADWAFGLNAVYWFVIQNYRGPDPPSSQSRYGNFMEISLSALYHF